MLKFVIMNISKQRCIKWTLNTQYSILVVFISLLFFNSNVGAGGAPSAYASCAGCHGQHGEKTGGFSGKNMIAGQPKDDLESKLYVYKSGMSDSFSFSVGFATWSTGTLSAIMVGVAQGLSNSDISEISEWLCEIPE